MTLFNSPSSCCSIKKVNSPERQEGGDQCGSDLSGTVLGDQTLDLSRETLISPH